MEPETTGGSHADFLRASSADISQGVFPLGANLDCVDPGLRLRDRHRRLNLAGLLDSTPLHWVYLDGYRIGRRMVTNGEYREFLLSDDGAFDDASLWRYVWEDLGLRVTSHPRYDQGLDGKVIHREDSHDEARNFVEAYVDSLEYEVRQWAEYEGPEEDPEASAGGIERLEAVARVFAFVKALLRDAIVTDVAEPVLLPEKQQTTEHYRAAGGAEALADDIQVIRALTIARISQLIPPNKRKKLQVSPQELVEAIALLDRVLAEWKQSGEAESIALHRVLYPRGWTTPEGERQARFSAPQVPWADRPVYGLTLYEAAAYCAWLSNKTEWAWQVELPNEAQYERAASWPNGDVQLKEGRLKLDPRQKHLFPWQGHCDKDFNDLFGQEQSALSLVWADPRRHTKLVERSSRNPGEEDQIDNLLGFGWQWCMERFDNAERRYARFESNALDPYVAVSVEDTQAGTVVPAFEYKPNTAPSHSFFVVRGAPEVLGGPGLTTRRFAMYPLRAYPNVGFRWVCTPRQETP